MKRTLIASGIWDSAMCPEPPDSKDSLSDNELTITHNGQWGWYWDGSVWWYWQFAVEED